MAVQMDSDSDCGVTSSRICCFHLSICFPALLMAGAGGVLPELCTQKEVDRLSGAHNDWNNIQIGSGRKA